MPECYTHTHIATQALMRSGQTVASRQAYLAGANGPDPLLMYRFFSKKREPDLPALGRRMHSEKTGTFLRALMLFAVTPVQQSYALGYLTHYTTDCTLNPYMAAMCRKGGPYEGDKGRSKMAARLDSTLYYNDYKTYLVPLHAGTPVLITEDLAQVAALLHDVILDVYKQDIPALALADTFHDNQSVRKFLISKYGVKKVVARLFGPALAGPKEGSRLASRMQPAGPIGHLPDHWTNPFTTEEIGLTLEEVVELAEQTGAACIVGGMRYWLGELDEDTLAEILGDNNYYTGLSELQQEQLADAKAAQKQPEETKNEPVQEEQEETAGQSATTPDI